MGKIATPPLHEIDEIGAYKDKRAKTDARGITPMLKADVAEGKPLSVTLVKREARRVPKIPSRNRLDDFDLVFTYQEKT